ncbi:MAG: FAD-binding protein [Gammaproteobacteria bacterium]|nr:FAD-binding protein [Gammaproteobacteria bacterium]
MSVTDTGTQPGDEAGHPHHYDLLVVGSGAGAFTAAVTTLNHGGSVLMVEKSDLFGGTSAMSGGGIWIPNSDNARRKGADDSAEQAYTYMRESIGNQVADDRVRAYVDGAPEMLGYLQANSALRYEAFPYPDYYSDTPGAKQGYRTQAPCVFKGRKLGDDLYKMRPQQPGAVVQGRFTLTFKEARKFLTQQKGWRLSLLKIIALYFADIPGRFKSKMSRRLTQGHSLIGSLYYTFKDKGGELWLNSPMHSLLQTDGRVTGAMVERDGELVHVSAGAVLLAAGGYEHNKEMREQSLPQPTNPDWSVSQVNNTGDSIRAATALGAKLALMNHAWWIPVVHVPGWPRPMGLFAERSLPGLVIVNQSGQRFANEALPYLEAGKAMYDSGVVPSWVIFDANFRHKYPFGPIGPGWGTPDAVLPKRVKKIMLKHSSIAELAAAAGIDAAGLASTIERNNEFAISGKDEDFQRGDLFYERYYGDERNQPNPCIAPIAKSPFYALPLYPGDIGTKGGLLTDANGQVLSEASAPIDGLYAAGNNAASVMGDKYLGAGATLGPAMTFAYLAALHAAGSAPEFRSDPGALSNQT